MTESEAIKRIKECRNTPNFQPYIYMNEALNMAIQALEKQIPKKVVKDGERRYKCPCCGGCAKTETGDSFIDYRLDYCDGCGQKLDWSDSD